MTPFGEVGVPALILVVLIPEAAEHIVSFGYDFTDPTGEYDAYVITKGRNLAYGNYRVREIILPWFILPGPPMILDVPVTLEEDRVAIGVLGVLPAVGSISVGFLYANLGNIAAALYEAAVTFLPLAAEAFDAQGNRVELERVLTITPDIPTPPVIPPLPALPPGVPPPPPIPRLPDIGELLPGDFFGYINVRPAPETQAWEPLLIALVPDSAEAVFYRNLLVAMQATYATDEERFTAIRNIVLAARPAPGFKDPTGWIRLVEPPLLVMGDITMLAAPFSETYYNGLVAVGETYDEATRVMSGQVSAVPSPMIWLHGLPPLPAIAAAILGVRWYVEEPEEVPVVPVVPIPAVGIELTAGWNRVVYNGLPGSPADRLGSILLYFQAITKAGDTTGRYWRCSRGLTPEWPEPVYCLIRMESPWLYTGESYDIQVSQDCSWLEAAAY